MIPPDSEQHREAAAFPTGDTEITLPAGDERVDRAAAGPVVRMKVHAEPLTRVMAAIADAVAEEQVYEALVDQTADVLGASSGGLFVRREDTGMLTLVHSVGYSPAAIPMLEAVPLRETPGFPAIDVIRTGEPMWIGSQEELLERYPHLAAHVTPGRKYSIGCIPLVVQGRAVASLAYTFDAAPPLNAAQRNLLLVVARYAGQALERLGLLERERRSREAAEAAVAHMEFLARASRAFTEAGTDPHALTNCIVEHVTADFADACGIMLIDASGERLEPGAVLHRNSEADAELRAMFTSPEHRVGEGLLGKVAATGNALFLRSMDLHETLKDAHPAYRDWLVRYRPQSMIVAPLRARGRTIGVLACLRMQEAGLFSDEDFATLVELAERAATALDNSRLYRENEDARSRAELLYELAASVNTSERLEDVLQTALNAVQQALGSRRSSILLYDASGVMRFRAWNGLSEEYRRAVDGHSPWTRDTVRPEPILVRDVARDEGLAPYLPVFRAEGIVALAFIPLLAGGRLIGKFMVYYDEPRSITAGELDMARAIAHHVAAAVARYAATSELKETVRFNEIFAGMLGHDLRNPLSAIMAAAELAMLRANDDKLATPLGRIINSGHRMSRMIDHLLDFTRVRVGRGIALSSQPLDVASVVRQVIDELEGANPECRIELEVTGEMTGRGDADRLYQVFSNLIGNAVQHGEAPHGVVVTLDGRASDAVCVRIHNRGAIPAGLLPRLFEPMSGGEARREKTQGLGLGLYITRELVAAHGGAITVESGDEAGTTFAISLPRGRPAPAGEGRK